MIHSIYKLVMIHSIYKLVIMNTYINWLFIALLVDNKVDNKGCNYKPQSSHQKAYINILIFYNL
jgi:hypothetical protein